MADRFWFMAIALALGVGVLVRVWLERGSGADASRRKCRSAVVSAIVLTYVATAFAYELVWMRG